MSNCRNQADMRALAAEERANLNLGPFAPLNPYDLAAEHGIPVYGICELIECAPPLSVRMLASLVVRMVRV